MENVYREKKTPTSISLPITLFMYQKSKIQNLSNWVAERLEEERQMELDNAFILYCPLCRAEMSSKLLVNNNGLCPSCKYNFKRSKEENLTAKEEKEAL